MSLIAISNKVDTIISQLSLCFEKMQVEKVFMDNGIDDNREKTELLRKCMGVRDISNIDDTLTDEDEYYDELEIFADNTWRFLN
jgi:hypothetical protein